MKRILIFWFLILPLTTFSQNGATILKKDLVGIWRIDETKVNGLIISDNDPSQQDEIILREDNTHTRTDKSFNYEESGPWRLIDNKFIELTDSKKNQKKLFEIISIQGRILKIRIMYDNTTIDMTLSKN